VTERLQLTNTDYDRFQDLVLRRCGLYFPRAKKQALARGLAEALAQSSCTDLGDYYEMLRTCSSSHHEWDVLISTLTVGETYFFRNKGHFDALEKHILPELIAEREHSSRRIRIWSAGCATGEEPYSLAMLLRELIRNPASWNILILATDINRAALRDAREGLYGTWSFRGVDPRIRDRYFYADGNGSKRFAIANQIKRMVTFQYVNLIEDYYPSLANNTNAMDVVLCRNVTIYFSSETTQQVVSKFHKCLTRGGWLIPGASEPNLVYYRDFQSRNFPGAVVYQRPTAAQAKSRATFVFTPLTTESKAPKRSPRPSASGGKRAKRGEERAPPAGNLFDQAVRLLEAGQADQALVKLYEHLDQQPDSAATYYTMGKIYANKGNLEEAQTWCERAIKKDRLQPVPYYTLSMIYQQHDLTDMAVDALKKAIYLDREFILAHYNLAQLYRQEGKGALARRSLQNAQRLLEGKRKNEPVPQGDGLVAGRLLQLVKMGLASGS